MCIITRTLCSSPLSWLPVLLNIEPPALRCKAAVDNWIEKTNLRAEWPLGNYTFFPSLNCLPSCRPLWTDIFPTDIISQWRDEWKSAPVVSSSLVDDPSIRKPGFDLPRSHWALLNCFQTNQGAYCLVAVDMCPCGRCQMRSHIVISHPQTKLEGELQRLHSADDVDTEWLKMYGL